MSTTWILGGHGFIGQDVVNLMKTDHSVITTSQSSAQAIHKNVPHFQIKYDITQFKKILRDQKIDTILFLSGNAYPAHSEHSPFYEIDHTYLPFLSLAEAVRIESPATKVWFASSVAVYGANQDPVLSEESKTQPLSFYGIAKQNIEEYIKYYSRVHKLNMGAYRLFSTYGPRLKRQLVYDLVQKMIQNPEKISVFGDGTEARDLSFVQDQAEAIYLVQNKIIPQGDIFNLGSGQLFTVNEIIKRLSTILKINPVIEYIPKRSFDGAKWRADISKIEKLGFKQKFDIDQGLQLTVNELLKKS